MFVKCVVIRPKSAFLSMWIQFPPEIDLSIIYLYCLMIETIRRSKKTDIQETEKTVMTQNVFRNLQTLTHTYSINSNKFMYKLHP